MISNETSAWFPALTSCSESEPPVRLYVPSDVNELYRAADVEVVDGTVPPVNTTLLVLLPVFQIRRVLGIGAEVVGDAGDRLHRDGERLEDDDHAAHECRRDRVGADLRAALTRTAD